MSQVDGSYPRLNASLLQSGKFQDKIVSVVGKIQPGGGGMNSVQFQCADGGIIQVDTEQFELPSLSPDAVVEIVGQAAGPNQIMVRQ